MKLSYRMKRVCGSVFENGNIIFTSDGNSVICPVGNRLTVFDLLQHSSYTLPFENRKNIKIIVVSHNGRFLISVDVDGHALFINLSRRVILERMSFKRKVYDIKFSPNDELFAVTCGHGCQIWRSPGKSIISLKMYISLIQCTAIENRHLLTYSTRIIVP
jgi:periodic tryptophan protein 2